MAKVVGRLIDLKTVKHWQKEDGSRQAKKERIEKENLDRYPLRRALLAVKGC